MTSLLDINPIELDREIVKRTPNSLYEFVKLAWPLVEASPFVDGRVIQVVCAHLMAVSHGVIKQLIINIPPGHSKSLLVNIFWPAWHWIKFTRDFRWLHTSYSDRLTRRDANKTLKLIQSKWFTDRWGALAIGLKPQTNNFQIYGGGWRISTTIRGQITGEHPDVQVCDDPHKPFDAAGGVQESKAELDAAYDIWTTTMATRARNPDELRRVIIMQRLHEIDLSGRMIDEGGYHLLRLPARYEREHHCPGDWRTVEGELLWPERFPATAVAATETRLATAANIASQLQQRPTPKGGLIFERAWIKHWHFEPGKRDPLGQLCYQLPKYGSKLASWDMSFKDGDGSDRVAGTMWHVWQADMFLIDLDADVVTFVQSLSMFLAMIDRHPDCIEKLVEDKANGPALMSVLESKIPGLTPIEPKGSKLSRASASAPTFRSGHIYFPHPELYPWVDDAIRELTGYPYGRYDDIVDSVSQAITHTVTTWQTFLKAMNQP